MGTATPSALEFLSNRDPVAEACEAAAVFAEGRGDVLHKTEYRRRGCERGRTASCVLLADSLAQDKRPVDAISLLGDIKGPCGRVPYSDGHAGYQGKECDEKLVDLLNGTGNHASIARRLCTEGHEEAYCHMTQSLDSPGGVVRIRARALDDRVAALARQEEEAAERSSEFARLSASAENKDSEPECRQSIQTVALWSPTHFVDVVPNISLGCAVSVEERCSHQQTVELWIWNHNEGPVVVDFKWSLEANVLVKGQTISGLVLEPGVKRFLASSHLEYARSDVTIRARATRCVFSDVRIDSTIDADLIPGNYQNVRLPLPIFPVAPDSLSEDDH